MWPGSIAIFKPANGRAGSAAAANSAGGRQYRGGLGSSESANLNKYRSSGKRADFTMAAWVAEISIHGAQTPGALA